jgi:CheY-like chemotaxis protein
MRAGTGIPHQLAWRAGAMTMDPGPRRRHKILIVDDDQSTRSGLKRFFERANYDVLAVSTFADGRQALAHCEPDFLIADVRLGEYNGLQLVATNPRSIPTIVVTGFADPVLEADAKRLGAEYLLKPVSPLALMGMVKQKLESVSEAGLPFRPGRRWTRKRVNGELSAHIDDVPARIIDISYGGLRFQIPRGTGPLPASLNVRLPSSDIAVRADVVWHRALGDDAWLCGAAVSQTSLAVARDWRGLVDGVSVG